MRSIRRDPPDATHPFLASVLKNKWPTRKKRVNFFSCEPWLFPGRSRGDILRPWNEIYRRNGSLKYEPRGLDTNAPGYWENILILVCTPSFGYETPVVTQIEPLRRHIPWLTGPQLEPTAVGRGPTGAAAAILAI